MFWEVWGTKQHLGKKSVPRPDEQLLLHDHEYCKNKRYRVKIQEEEIISTTQLLGGEGNGLSKMF